MGFGGQHHTHGCFPPRKTIYRKLGGPTGLYGRVWEIFYKVVDQEQLYTSSVFDLHWIVQSQN